MTYDVDKKFYLSFLIIIIFGALTDINTQILYFNFKPLSFYKYFFNSYIYISLFYLPLSNLNKLNYFFNDYVKYFFIILIFYGLLIILLSVGSFTSLVHNLGAPSYGPIFLSPLFFLWGTQIIALFWFNKLCLLSILIGILIFPLSFILKFDIALNLFLPIFFLIITFNYQSFNNKIIIITATFISWYCFLFYGYRFGNLLIFFSIIILLLSLLQNKFLLYSLRLFFVVSPLLFYFLYIKFQFNIFEYSSTFFDEGSTFGVDTRSLLYSELFSQLNTKEILFGKGVLGSYYSKYFYSLNYGGDHFIRRSTEVGFLHFVLKGGIFYFLIFYLFFTFISLKKYSSIYFSTLGLFISVFLSMLFIENHPYFSVKIILMWILISICASRLFNNYTDAQIKKIIVNEIYPK